jgi:hypothetical protein
MRAIAFQIGPWGKQTTRIFPLGFPWNRSFGLYPSDTAFLPIDTLFLVDRVLGVEREGNLAPSLPEPCMCILACRITFSLLWIEGMLKHI